MVIKEAIDHVPPPLLQQLKRGGRMVIPLGPAQGPQYLTLVTRDAQGKLAERRIMPVRFSPLQGGERTGAATAQRPSRYQAEPRVPSSSISATTAGSSGSCEAPVTR